MKQVQEDFFHGTCYTLSCKINTYSKKSTIFVTLNCLVIHVEIMLSIWVSRNMILLLLLLGIRSGAENGFNSLQPDERKAAIEWFESGQFEKALPVFSKLVYNFPYDFIVKYYYGACLVETGKNGLDAEKNLTLASTQEVPVRVFYYLGRFYHSGGNWNNALRYYNRFKNSAESSEIQTLGINDLIGLCYSKINPFISETPQDSSITGNQTLLTEITGNHALPDSVNRKSTTTVNKLSDKADSFSLKGNTDADKANNSGKGVDNVTLKQETKTGDEKITLPVFINFQINNNVVYLIEEMFHVTEAKVEFRTAAEKERLLDSLLQEVQHLRKLYHHNVNPVLRDSLATKIQNFEYRNLVLNTEVDQHYNLSRKLEQEWWDKADPSFLEAYTELKDSLIRLQYAAAAEVQIPDSVNISVPDTLATDSVAVSENENTLPDQANEELVYKIQIGAYDKGIPNQRRLLFEKLEKIRTIDTLKIENGVTVYTSGNLKNISDALKMQAQIRQEGIKDAFVIAVKDGKRIPLPGKNNETEK
jgi:hypothetical protein